MPEPPAPCPACGQRPFAYLAAATRRERLLVSEAALRLATFEDATAVVRFLDQLLERPPLRDVPTGTEALVLALAALRSDYAERALDPADPLGLTPHPLLGVPLDAEPDEEARVTALRAHLGGVFA